MFYFTKKSSVRLDDLLNLFSLKKYSTKYLLNSSNTVKAYRPGPTPPFHMGLNLRNMRSWVYAKPTGFSLSSKTLLHSLLPNATSPNSSLNHYGLQFLYRYISHRYTPTHWVLTLYHTWVFNLFSCKLNFKGAFVFKFTPIFLYRRYRRVKRWLVKSLLRRELS